MALYDFFVSRNNSVPNVAAYIGHAGRLFYDSTNGVVKLSDGVTPGGTAIPYTIATTTVIGGIKAGPGANVATDGTLTINTAGLPLSFGNLTANDNILSTVNSNADLVLSSNGIGNVELVGNVRFYSTAQTHNGTPYFKASGDGQLTILVPASDPTAGAVRIVGSLSGNVYPPINTGVMLHVTGNNNDGSRIYNDGVGSFAAYVGRRLNGNVSSPTAVQAGNEIIRISSTGYNGTTIPGSGSARILYQAIENYTSTAAGTNISIWTTAVGSNVLTKTATFDSNGITTPGTTINADVTTSGNVTAARRFVGAAGIRAIQDGIWANLSFATDNLVHVYNPSGDLTVNLSNYTAGATITCIVSMDTRRGITYGVAAARNSTTGATSIASTSLLNNQAVQLTYTCLDGTAANTYVAVSRV